jgi:hypothetical protein
VEVWCGIDIDFWTLEMKAKRIMIYVGTSNGANAENTCVIYNNVRTSKLSA